MSCSTEQRDSYASSARPSSFPMPRSFYASTDQEVPWLSCDPFLLAECKAVYRSVRFALLALLGLLTAPRSSKADPVHQIDVQWMQATERAPHSDGSNRSCVQAIRQAAFMQRLCARSEQLPLIVPITATNVPKRSIFDLQVQRAHAPPISQTSILLSRLQFPFASTRHLPSLPVFSPNSARRSQHIPTASVFPTPQSALILLEASQIADAKFGWLRFDVERSHAPPASAFQPAERRFPASPSLPFPRHAPSCREYACAFHAPNFQTISIAFRRPSIGYQPCTNCASRGPPAVV